MQPEIGLTNWRSMEKNVRKKSKIAIKFPKNTYIPILLSNDFQLLPPKKEAKSSINRVYI